jgi:hypothetical protein
LRDEFVSASNGAAAGSNQDLLISQGGRVFQHHLKIRIEAPRCYDDGFAAHLDRLAGFGATALQADDAAVLAQQAGNFGLRNNLAALCAEAFNELRRQSKTAALRPRPAQHRVALLEFQISPFHAEPFGPVIKIVQTVLDVIARPDRIGGCAAPRDPVAEGKIGGIMNATVLLQRRAYDQAAAAGCNRGAAGLGIHLEGDGARTCVARLDAGRHAGAARADDGDVGLVLFHSRHCSLYCSPG